MSDPAPPPAPRASSAVPAGFGPLSGVDGLDLAAGLRQCAGRPAMYRHMLGRFAELYARPLALPAAAADGPDAAMRDAAHSLRGASATVGAVQVQRLAAALEQLCAEPAPVAARLQAHAALAQTAAALVAALRERLPRLDAPVGR